VNSDKELAWQLIAELRKEILESQRIRAQIIGFKITFVSAGVGVVVANLHALPQELLVIPAFAAIFFDFLVNSYSVSIKRIAYYCRTHLEPRVRTAYHWPAEQPLWEEFMSRPTSKQWFSLIGNLGLTALAVAPAAVALARSRYALTALLLGAALALLFGYDASGFFGPRRMAEGGPKPVAEPAKADG
jgi:hypothetical protein